MLGVNSEVTRGGGDDEDDEEEEFVWNVVLVVCRLVDLITAD
jgi:hypothetical protein